MAEYYTRIQGRILGPIAAEDLLAMKAKGQLRKFHEISVDRRNWRPAAEFDALFAENRADSSAAPRWPTASRRPRINRLMATSIVGIILLAICGGGYAIWKSQKKSTAPPTLDPDTSTIGGQNEEDLSKALGMVACGIEITEANGDRWVKGMETGSCFAISPNGHLLTNRHVVLKTYNLQRSALLENMRAEHSIVVSPRVWVFLNKKKYDAELLHVDNDYDFSVMKIAGDTPTFFLLSGKDKIARQARVSAYGFPGVARETLTEDEIIQDIRSKTQHREGKIDDYFKKRDLEFSSSSGTVSRNIDEEVGRIGVDRRAWIEHTSTINPGNSGGPLLDDDGVVVGINTLGAAKGSGIFWALSLAQIRDEIQKHSPKTKWK